MLTGNEHAYAYIFSIPVDFLLFFFLFFYFFQLSSFELTREDLEFRATLEVLDFPNSQLKYF